MTIDEHIKHIQGTIEWAKAFGGEDDDNLIIMWTEQLEMLEELKWYREQDFIKREYAIWWLCRDCEDCMFDCENCQTAIPLNVLEYELKHMTKAEPPFAKDTNVPINEGDEDAD